MLRKDFRGTSTSLNSFLEKDLGDHATPGPFGHFDRWGQQDERAGPQLFGKIFDIGPGSLEWSGGVLFGLTSRVPALTVRGQAKYQIHY